MPTFSSVKELETHLSKLIQNATMTTARIVSEKLKEFIQTDFYDQFSPTIYERTWQLLNSVDVASISTSAIVFIDSSSMEYKEATGSYVVDLAAQGYHGIKSIQTSGRFWIDYIDWCNQNIYDILKNELRKQGL